MQKTDAGLAQNGHASWKRTWDGALKIRTLKQKNGVIEWNIAIMGQNESRKGCE